MVLYLQVGILLLFGVGIGAVVGTFISVSQMLPRVTDYSPPEVTKIYSNDNVLLATVGEENREFVELKQIPKHLINATIAIEDSRFYEHAGVDFRGIMRAVVENIRGGGMMQGGSTITQQLARNVFLTQKKTFSRKAREAVLAVMIERNYTKPKILELYLNQVYFGSGSFGVEAASKIYFDKNVRNLGLAESALIAGLPKRPTYYSPHTNLEGAINRRNVVLARMAELGYISPEERDKAQREKPRIVALKPTKYRSKAPYFTDYVKKYLRERYEYGDDLIYRAGLRVYTTINYKMQVEAQRAVRRGVAEARQRGQIDNIKGNAALVCIESGTGYIRAMVGGEDYEKSEFNRAVQAMRQPGSSFKAFVYTAAVDTLGWDGHHTISGSRYTYVSDIGKVWSPRNYDGKYPGLLTVEQAVARSVNTAAARAASQVGLYTVIKYARLMGVKSKLEPYPAIAIGGIGGLRVLEMASAYGVFASGGRYAEPIPIAKITDSEGALIEEANVQSMHVLPDRTVKVMDGLFRAVVTTGTGRRMMSIPEARGKTGTTNDDIDAWFIGYVPKKLVTAVWMGNDDYKPMRKVFGGTVCGPVWKDFMEDALKVYDATHRPKFVPKHVEPQSNEVEKQVAPENQEPQPVDDTAVVETDGGTVRVKICDESQLIATRNCPSWHAESFPKGTEPSMLCDIHGPRPREGQNGNVNPPREPSGGGEDGLRLTPPPPILPD
ncbi:MAG: PBP1A family penicillin-binding protein [Armatimonadetes bacterium]|nr:PBP1A family penicillin-binding protein [Armatimonadota bacterium]